MVIANPSTVRGLDFPFLEHIILVEVPSDYIEYLHAAGRVGRLGGRGTVTTLVCNDGKSLHRLTFIYQKLGLTALKVQANECIHIPDNTHGYHACIH